MVSQAIDEGLLRRIQVAVANDINHRIQSQIADDPAFKPRDPEFRVLPDDIHILSFERVLNNWTATATASTEAAISSFYKLVHDGSTETTLIHLYFKHSTFAAVV